MPQTPTSDFQALLRLLKDYDVDFIVVGGVGAALQGAPASTFELGVVHSTQKDNVARLLAALDPLEAYFRAQPERKLRPTASQLSSSGHQLLMTRFGPLDVLGSIGRAHSYQDLLATTVATDLGGGVMVRVLNLETLIAVKEETADAKDFAVLPILRRTLAEKKRPLE